LKHVEVKAVAFFYSCLSGDAEKTAVLANAIREYLSRNESYLIIVDDTIRCSVSGIIQTLDLKKHSKVIVCCKTSHGWAALDLMSSTSGRVTNPMSAESVLEWLQHETGILRENTIVVGHRGAHLDLRNRSLVYFHVGKQEVLVEKMRNLIPLSEQYEIGLSNILTYLCSRGCVDNAIDYNDLLTFIANAREFFQSGNAANSLWNQHIEFAQFLKERFRDEIVGVFGTGYPFYLFGKPPQADTIATPKSILSYFDIQHKYFSNKLLAEDEFSANCEKYYSIEELSEEFFVAARRNEFAERKVNYSDDLTGECALALRDYYSRGCFEIPTDIWTCYYCAHLQFDDWFPRQNILKHTDETCLSCKQTCFMLRNIMGCAPDIDVVVVVKEDKIQHAKIIKEYIAHESSYVLYDSDFYRTVVKGDSLVDLFVTEKADICSALHSLSGDGWINASFDSIALWYPSVECSAKLGLNFPLSFEPLFVRDSNLSDLVLDSRRRFAEQHSVERIIRTLSEASFYTQQLMKNEDIVEILTEKMLRWKRL
jgi:hypothetical protein